MKKLLAVLLALTLVLSMSAVAFAAEDGKITIWTWDPNFNIASMKIGAEMYNADHPDVEIEIQEVASEDIETAVAQAAVAGNLDTLPDIMLCQDNSFQKMVTNYPEVYTDLTDLYDFEGFGPAKQAYSIIDGRHYGIPFDAGTVVGTFNGCWILATILSLDDQAGKWDITNMPKLANAEGATNYSNNGGSSWAITQGTDVDLALDFMQLYRNVDFYNAILPTTSAIATFSPAKEGEAYSAPSEFFNGTPIFATILEFGEQVPSNITGAYYYDARNAMATAITNYINGADLDAELAQAEDTVNFAMGF